MYRTTSSSKLLAVVFTAALLCGCENHGGDKTQQFLKATSEVYFKAAPEADSAFRGVALFLPSKPEVHYVYILDASCSVCIADALDCYGAFDSLELGQDDGAAGDFMFVSKTEDTEIFEYYFREKYGDKTPGCHYYFEFDLPNGIYTVRQGKLIAYSPWR